MDRRGFMKDVTQAGIGLGVPGLVLGKDASTATSPNRQTGDAVILLDGTWLLQTDPDNVGREQK